MKPDYFVQGYPDEDDELHFKAIEEKIVGEGCMMGGVPIYAWKEKGFDICQLCPFKHRDICGGRPKNANGSLELPTRTEERMNAERGIQGTGAARQMLYQMWIDQSLNPAVEKALAELKEKKK